MSANTNFLRTSVFDAALDLGLIDSGVTDWLDQDHDEKSVDPQRERIPNWPLSPPESESSHLTHSGSSHGHYSPPTSTPLSAPKWPSVPHTQAPYTLTPYAPRVGTNVALRDALSKTKLGNANAPSGAPIFQYPSHFPQQTPAPPPPAEPLVKPRPPPTRQPTKLTKKKAQRVDSEYSFIQNDPNANPYANAPARNSVSRERSFFGRLRDRSRSKAGKPSAEFIREQEEEFDQQPDLNVVRSFSPPRRKGNPILVERKESRRGRNAVPKPVQRIRVGEAATGAPQLYIENRQSADLLSSFAAELDAVGLAGSALADTSSTTTAKETYAFAGSNVMDRPHPKVRQSGGFWENRQDKIATAARIAAYRAAGPGTVKKGLRSSGSLKRNGSGVKRVGSGRRRATSSNTRRKPATDSSRNSSTTRDEHSDHSEYEDEDDKEKEKEETIDEVPGESPVLPSHPTVPVPTIIQRKPSLSRSAAANLPPLEISRPSFDTMPQRPSGDTLMPGDAPIPRPSLDSPGSARRGANPRRLSHLYSPSPFKPPSTPLPPTPGGGPSPVPPVARPTTGKRSDSAGSGSGKSSFESARRAPTDKPSDRAPIPTSSFEHIPVTPTLPLRAATRPYPLEMRSNLAPPEDSSPNSPSSEYVVPSPLPMSPSDVTFPSSVVPPGSGVVPRGRMETTPEGRARAGSMNSGYFPESVVRKPAVSAPSPIPERLMARPKPGALVPSASLSDIRENAARRPALGPSMSLSERRPPQLQLRGPSPSRNGLQRTPTNPTPRTGLLEAPGQPRGLARSPTNLNVIVRPNRKAERIQSIYGEIGKFPSPVSATFPTTPQATSPQPNLLVPPKIVARRVDDESDVSRSIYSTGEGWSDTDDDDRFALDVDELEETSRSFEVLAALLSAPSTTKTALHRDMRPLAAPVTPTAAPPSFTPAIPAPQRMPPVSPLPVSPLSHSPSRKRTPMGAGGARWI